VSLDPNQILGTPRAEAPPDGLPDANALGRIYTSESEQKGPPGVKLAFLDPVTTGLLASGAAEATGVGAGAGAGTAGALGTGAIVSNPVGWIVGGVIVVGGGGYLLYRYLHQEPAKKEEATTDTDGNVKVKDCDIKPYKKQKCPDGYEAHHLVPDYVLRYGTRDDSSMRVGGMPSLADGPAICVKGGAKEQGSEHNQFHAAVDPAIAALGDENGLAKLKDVIAAVKKQAAKVKPQCKQAIDEAIDKAFGDKDPDTLVRTTQQPLTPRAPKTTTPEALP
jgi:hypothetical protein